MTTVNFTITITITFLLVQDHDIYWSVQKKRLWFIMSSDKVRLNWMVLRFVCINRCFWAIEPLQFLDIVFMENVNRKMADSLAQNFLNLQIWQVETLQPEKKTKLHEHYKRRRKVFYYVNKTKTIVKWFPLVNMMNVLKRKVLVTADLRGHEQFVYLWPRRKRHEEKIIIKISKSNGTHHFTCEHVCYNHLKFDVQR